MKTHSLKALFDSWVVRPLLCARLALPGDLLAGGPDTAADPRAGERAAAQSPEAQPLVEVSADTGTLANQVFDEPLVALGGEPRADQTKALSEALWAYAHRSNRDDFSSLTAYLQAQPASPWCASLLLHLGVEYYNYGYFSRALEAWQHAWELSKATVSGAGKAQADRALGELARMYSRLGRMQELAQLLDSTKDRDLDGPATQLVGAARGALWMMQTKPDYSFGCGPSALDRILLKTDPARAGNPVLLEYKSGTNGFCLSRVAELSRKLGMNYQMAFRSPGSELIIPSVIHWKVGHYAALVQREAGRVLAQDYTFRQTVWMTTTALDEEASGYFLVRAGPLPKGWRPVSESEAQGIWGKGLVGSQYPDATTHWDTHCGPCDFFRNLKNGISSGFSAAADWVSGLVSGPPSHGMTTYSMHAMLVSLILSDAPVGYTPPVGPPIYFQATYHQREANQPAVFSYSNLGPKWNCNWLSYVTDNPNNPGADVSLYVAGGGTLHFTGFNAASQAYAPEAMSQAILVVKSSSAYELQYPDGTRNEFSKSDGSLGSSRRVFLTQLIDPAGNVVQLNYDNQLRITSVVDAIGQATAFQYTNAAYPFAITGVMDPFGRAATLQYDASGLLTQITDVLGLASQYTYGSNQFVTKLTTPYGVTTFATGSTNGVTYLMATDPLGQTERLEYTQNPVVAHSYPASLVPHGLSTFNLFLDARNSFYWDKNAYTQGAGDYSKARNYHWLHYTPNPNDCAPILESEKGALEGRVWFNFPGQPTNDSAPYYFDAAYTGASSKPSVVSSLLDDGTTQTYSYAYNALGNLTRTVDPLGRSFTYVYATNNVDLLEVRMTHNTKNELMGKATYNSQHLPLAVTDAAGQTTTHTYNSRGQLLTTVDPAGHVTTLSYDPKGYLVGIVGPLGAANGTASFTYDALGRMHTATDTEGYTLTLDYDNFDRVTQVTFPDGTSEQHVFDRLNLAAFKDRLGRWATNTYNAIGKLASTQDSLGRTTLYEWCQCGSPSGITDPLGRTTRWIYDEQSRPVAKQYADGSTESYSYEPLGGRLSRRRDPGGQETVFAYYADNSLRSVDFVNSQNPTPGVKFTYDPDYNRVATMQDGIGTTLYSYYPISASPVLGAGRIQSVSGPLPNSLVAYQYDEVGRETNRAIAGVAQVNAYDELSRLSTVQNALGTFAYSHLRASPRPTAIAFPNGQTNLFSYYDNTGDQRLKQISNLKPDGSVLSAFGYSYDAAGQITTWTNVWDALPKRVWVLNYDAANQLVGAVRTDGSTPLSTNTYAYDPAGNRILAAVDGSTNRVTYNALNQIMASGTDPVNDITYDWDAVHRLIAVTQGNHRSEFSYDGLDRRVRIVEKTNGVVVADNYFLWCGTELCEMRDATGANTVRRFFPQGEQLVSGGGNTNLFYVRDHLGSIRESVTAAGTLNSRYDYDPYGQQTVLSEASAASFAFTGQFQHRASGLNFALYRALDPRAGRWLNRDPLGEAAGFNLYAYVNNNPVNFTDPSGEILPIIAALAIVGALAAAGYAGYEAFYGDHPPVTTGGETFLFVFGGAAVGAVAGWGLNALAVALTPIAPAVPFAGPVIVRLLGRITNTDCP